MEETTNRQEGTEQNEKTVSKETDDTKDTAIRDTETSDAVAKNTDTRLEINSSHGFLNSSQLVKIKSIGNKFIIGSDAHVPQNVGNFDLAMKIVKEASVDLSLIENIKI